MIQINSRRPCLNQVNFHGGIFARAVVEKLAQHPIFGMVTISNVGTGELARQFGAGKKIVN